jgi:hypothetical protein
MVVGAGGTRHGRHVHQHGNARTCRKDTEISSESDVSTTYIGSLFDSDEIEEL